MVNCRLRRRKIRLAKHETTSSKQFAPGIGSRIFWLCGKEKTGVGNAAAASANRNTSSHSHACSRGRNNAASGATKPGAAITTCGHRTVQNAGKNKKQEQQARSAEETQPFRKCRQTIH